MKKLSAILTVLVLFVVCAALLPAQAQAAETDGPLTYIIAQGNAIITDCDESISGNFTIPATLGGCPVTVIEDGALYHCDKLTSITTLPESIPTIPSDPQQTPEQESNGGIPWWTLLIVGILCFAAGGGTAAGIILWKKKQ